MGFDGFLKHASDELRGKWEDIFEVSCEVVNSWGLNKLTYSWSQVRAIAILFNVESLNTVDCISWGNC